MYHAVVRRRVAQTFEALSRGDYEFALAGMAARFEHIFAGNHALGGTRHTLAGMRLWFERMFRLNQKLEFAIQHIAVSGTPWDTTAIIEWRDTATLANGDTSYLNDGTHVIRMRWGKVVSLHAYLDTEKVVTVFRQMAAQGFAEAVAAPIED
jgi:ketosteroid isomerase-like protein